MNVLGFVNNNNNSDNLINEVEQGVFLAYNLSGSVLEFNKKMESLFKQNAFKRMFFHDKSIAFLRAYKAYKSKLDCELVNKMCLIDLGVLDNKFTDRCFPPEVGKIIKKAMVDITSLLPCYSEENKLKLMNFLNDLEMQTPSQLALN